MCRHVVRHGVGLMLTGWELALGLGAMFFGAIVLGTISFGLGTVSMPFMLLILPPQDAVVTVNAVVVLTTGLTVIQTWRRLNLRESWPFVVAGLPPVPIGVLLLHEADAVALRLTIVVVILALGVMSLFQIRLPGARSRWAAPVCGFIATLLVTTLGVGAPLAGLYSIEQDWSRDTIRATLGLYFFLASVLALVAVRCYRIGQRDDGPEHWRAQPGRIVWYRRCGGHRQSHQPTGFSVRGRRGDSRWQRVAAASGTGASGLADPVS